VTSDQRIVHESLQMVDVDGREPDELDHDERAYGVNANEVRMRIPRCTRLTSPADAGAFAVRRAADTDVGQPQDGDSPC
jgi:hypothetical protein